MEELSLKYSDEIEERIKKEIKIEQEKERNEIFYINEVRKDWRALENIENQTYNICLEAIASNGKAIQYVKEQSRELCLEAIKKDVFNLQFIKEQDEEICLNAIRRNGFVLQYSKVKTPNLCFEAINEIIKEPLTEEEEQDIINKVELHSNNSCSNNLYIRVEKGVLQLSCSVCKAILWSRAIYFKALSKRVIDKLQDETLSRYRMRIKDEDRKSIEKMLTGHNSCLARCDVKTVYENNNVVLKCETCMSEIYTV